MVLSASTLKAAAELNSKLSQHQHFLNWDSMRCSNLGPYPYYIQNGAAMASMLIMSIFQKLLSLSQSQRLCVCSACNLIMNADSLKSSSSAIGWRPIIGSTAASPDVHLLPMHIRLVLCMQGDASDVKGAQAEAGPYWSLMFEVSESNEKPVNQKSVSVGGGKWPEVVRECIIGALNTKMISKDDQIVSLYHR